MIEAAAIGQHLGREWAKCPFEWDLDNHVTIESNQGKLILCDVFMIVSGEETGKVTLEPIEVSELKVYSG